MAQVLVRDLDDAVIARLKQRAREHGRSLQAELKALLEREARTNRAAALAFAARMRKQLAGRKHSESAALLAEDRAR